jgi:hypothetical protein
MTLHKYSWLIFLALLGANSIAAAEITGKVREVSGNMVTVVIDGDASPAVADSVEIFFKLAGANDEIMVATGKIVTIDAKVAKVSVETATGTVLRDQLVRIKSLGVSKAPAQSPATTVTRSSSIVGDWVSSLPDGSTVSFSFRPDGTLLWVIEEPKSARSSNGKYRVDASTQPQMIVLSDLEEGEMKGITLPGIFEFQSDGRLRLDFKRDSDAPPKEFSEQALLFSKATSPVVRPNKPPPPTSTAYPTSTPYVAPPPSADEALITEAKQRHDSGDDTGAIELLNKALALNPKNASAFFWRGMCFSGKKDWAAAIADFEKTMELDPARDLRDLIDKTKVVLQHDVSKPTSEQATPAATRTTRPKKKQKP